jgi:hypothetical protein
MAALAVVAVILGGFGGWRGDPTTSTICHRAM